MIVALEPNKGFLAPLKERRASIDQDVELIAQARAGDNSAYTQIVSKYSNLVGSIAYNMVGEIHTAADLTQDVFLKVHRNLYALEDARKFKGWICSITRSTSIDYLRKRKHSVKVASLEKIAEDGLNLNLK